MIDMVQFQLYVGLLAALAFMPPFTDELFSDFAALIGIETRCFLFSLVFLPMSITPHCIFVTANHISRPFTHCLARFREFTATFVCPYALAIVFRNLLRTGLSSLAHFLDGVRMVLFNTWTVAVKIFMPLTALASGNLLPTTTLAKGRI